VKYYEKGILYWMVSQILIKIGMFISPFVLSERKLVSTYGPTCNMIFGAIVVILGFGVSLYEFYLDFVR
jgi:uncharacterized Tic20 family protein